VKIKDHAYEYDTVVIGGSLSAVLYSYFNDFPLIYKSLKKPFRFDFFDCGFDLSTLNHQNEIKYLKTLKDKKQVGFPKLRIFEELLFLMSLSGKIPLADKVETITLEEENKVKIITKNYKLIRFKYNNLIIFDDGDIQNPPEANPKQSEMFRIIDWINVRSGTKHAFDYFETEDNFVKEIFFYPSDRIDGNHDKKDLVSISFLTKEEVSDIDFSEIYVNFKVKELMKSSGIKGRRNGRDVNNPERIIYRAVNTEHAQREVEPLVKNSYENQDNLFFLNYTPEHIIKYFSKPKSYAKKIGDIFKGIYNA